MKTRITQMMSVTMLLLAACGGGDDGKTSDAEQEQQQESVFDPLTDSLDKAKGVQDTVLQQKEDLDEALRQMEEDEDSSDEDSTD